MTITIDMEKARNIHRDLMRQARAPKLAALDIAFQRALEKGSGSTQIVKQKHALRDVTSDPAIEAARNADELKAVWPEILGD